MIATGSRARRLGGDRQAGADLAHPRRRPASCGNNSQPNRRSWSSEPVRWAWRSPPQPCRRDARSPWWPTARRCCRIWGRACPTRSPRRRSPRDCTLSTARPPGSTVRARWSCGDGSRVEADLIVTAIGDIPNTEWLATSGLLTDGRLEADSRRAGRARHRRRRGRRGHPDAAGCTPNSVVEQRHRTGQGRCRRAPDRRRRARTDLDPYFWTEQFGLNLKATGHLPAAGEPEFLLGDSPLGPSVMRWTHNDGHGVAVAVNHRIPIPRLRRMASAAA